MATLIITHEVDDVDQWLSSPRRMELFGPLGMTARTFVVDRDPHRGVGVRRAGAIGEFADARR